MRAGGTVEGGMATDGMLWRGGRAYQTIGKAPGRMSKPAAAAACALHLRMRLGGRATVSASSRIREPSAEPRRRGGLANVHARPRLSYPPHCLWTGFDMCTCNDAHQKRHTACIGLMPERIWKAAVSLGKLHQSFFASEHACTLMTSAVRLERFIVRSPIQAYSGSKRQQIPDVDMSGAGGQGRSVLMRR